MNYKEEYRKQIEDLLQKARDLKDTESCPENCLYEAFGIREEILFTDEYNSEDIDEINDIIWSYFEYYKEHYGYPYPPEQMEEDFKEMDEDY